MNRSVLYVHFYTPLYSDKLDARVSLDAYEYNTLLAESHLNRSNFHIAT